MCDDSFYIPGLARIGRFQSGDVARYVVHSGYYQVSFDFVFVVHVC